MRDFINSGIDSRLHLSAQQNLNKIKQNLVKIEYAFPERCAF